MMNKSGRCIHFNGTGPNDSKCCEAGVNYRAHVGGPDFGWCTRLPCLVLNPKQTEGRVPCSKYQEPTAEQIAEDQRKLEAFMQRMTLLSPILLQIKTDHRNQNWAGTVECPACKGALSIRINAYNGHTRGRCGTEGCFNWIE